MTPREMRFRESLAIAGTGLGMLFTAVIFDDKNGLFWSSSVLTVAGIGFLSLILFPKDKTND